MKSPARSRACLRRAFAAVNAESSTSTTGDSSDSGSNVLLREELAALKKQIAADHVAHQQAQG